MWLWYFFDWAPGLAAAATSLLLAWWLCSERVWRIALVFTSLLAIAVSCLLMTATILSAPAQPWPESRLAPVASWILAGDKLYYPPGQGPVLVRMYSPISSLIYLPTLLVTRPSTVVYFGTAISFFMLLLPLTWLLRESSRGVDGKWADPALRFAAFSAFLVVVCFKTILPDVAGTVTIDSPAIGFAVCACALLMNRAWRPDPSALWNGIGCGLLLACSVWSKQTMWPILAALVIYSFLVRGWRWGFRYSAALLLTVAVVSAVLLLAFDVRAMAIHMWIVPWRHRSYWPALSRTHVILRAMPYIMRLSWLAIGLLGGAIALKVWLRGRYPSNVEDRPNWATRNPWLLPMLAGVIVLPTTATAMGKYPGALANNAAATACFAYVAAIGAWIGLISRSPAAHTSISTLPRRLVYLVLIELMIGIALVPQWSRNQLRALPQSLHDAFAIGKTDNDVALDYLRSYPSSGVYFPTLPLASILAERRTHHSDQGLADLDRAHIAIPAEQLASGLPPNLRAIAFPRNVPLGYLPRLLPQFSQEIQPDDLPPGWVKLVRPTTLEAAR